MEQDTDSERRRLADRLHDNLQQLLVAAKLHLASAPEHDAVADAVALLDEALQETRNLVADLKAGNLPPPPAAAAPAPEVPAASPPGNAIRVLLADDHHVVRRGLLLLLDEPGFAVVGEAVSGAEAVAMARQLRPDVILMDFNMPDMNGVEATRAITGEDTGMRIVGLSVFDDPDAARSMLDAGACGYLAKGSSQAELLQAIRAAVRNEPA